MLLPLGGCGCPSLGFDSGVVLLLLWRVQLANLRYDEWGLNREGFGECRAPPTTSLAHAGHELSTTLFLCLIVSVCMSLLASGGPKLSWQTWAFADIMTDAYMKKRTSELPDLVALAASAAFVSKALAALCQASVERPLLLLGLFCCIMRQRSASNLRNLSFPGRFLL